MAPAFMNDEGIASPDRTGEPLLEARDIATHFDVRRGMFAAKATVKAVDGVSLTVHEGETLGLVGESGCGKSTLGRTLLRLVEPTAGTIRFEGQDITRLPPAQLRPLRRRMQMIFQDPYASLNPRMRVRDIVGEALDIHGLATPPADREARVDELLTAGGPARRAGRALPARVLRRAAAARGHRAGARRVAALHRRRRAHQRPRRLHSGADRQPLEATSRRSSASRTSSSPTTSPSCVDLSRRVAVMYLGRVVEEGGAAELSARRRCTRTPARCSRRGARRPTPAKRRVRLPLEGDVPSPLNPPAGCAFHPRCSIAQKGLCDKEIPTLRDLAPAARASPATARTNP
jgi:peptide/nickel transport system ATP-binding protein